MSLKIDQAFRERLREERERLGFTQHDFAESVGIKRITQHLYEKNNKSFPNHKYYLAIADLGVDLHYVLFNQRGAGQGLVLDPQKLSDIYLVVDEIATDKKGKPLPVESRLKLFNFLCATYASNPDMDINIETMKRLAS